MAEFKEILAQEIKKANRPKPKRKIEYPVSFEDLQDFYETQKWLEEQKALRKAN